jgi:hypothetical protein
MSGDPADPGAVGEPGTSGAEGDRSRRGYLRTVGTLAGTGLAGTSLAGCLGTVADLASDDGSGDGQPQFQRVEDPPDVVYVPDHREGTEMLGPVTTGPYRLRPMISYAHQFWTVTGGTVEQVEVESDDDVHLMVAVEDAQTGAALPVGSGLSTTVRRDGRLIDDRSPWRMLSQTMGFHFGDNVPLEADGTYEVTVSLPPLDVRRTGAFAGRFEEPRTATFTFEYEQALRDRLIEGIQYVDDAERGVPGAISPMDTAGSLPRLVDLPGTLEGVPAYADGELPRSHDADVPITVVPDFLGDGEPYLLVSPRTPYNRFPLVGAALDATVRHGDGSRSDVELDPTVDPAIGLHYGAPVPGVAAGDGLMVSFASPPSVARHAGYQTAFLEMEPIEVTLEAR